jgi:hypothetical protein
MAGAVLVGPEVPAGARLIDDLREGGIDVIAAAWVFEPERDRWRLHIVAPWPFGRDGNAYESLTPFFGFGLGKPVDRPIRLEDTVPHFPGSQYARALATLTGGTGEATRRVSDRYVEGLFFQDAIVYGRTD